MMEKPTTSPAEQPGTEQSITTAPEKTAQPAKEHRQAYGTAKTENLRDSGLYRILLPAFVLICCILVLVFPLLILIPLLTGAVTNMAPDVATAHQLLIWVWVVMITLELIIAGVIIRYFYRTFINEERNYQRL